MRDRHQPRLCRVCTAPMARQERVCSGCGAVWNPGPETPVALEHGSRIGAPRHPAVATASDRVAS